VAENLAAVHGEAHGLVPNEKIAVSDSQAAKKRFGAIRTSSQMGPTRWKGLVVDEVQRAVNDQAHVRGIDLRAPASVERVEVADGDRVGERSSGHRDSPAPADDRGLILRDTRRDFLLVRHARLRVPLA
jgi:hypothetical protein